MTAPVTTTTDHNELLIRFLSAAGSRINNYGGRVPFNAKEGRLVIAWLRGLVGKVNEDGSLAP